MNPPPILVEFLLEGLGADAEYRDAILGDFAEEFAQRSNRDGEQGARRWYYVEAIRTMPHLVRGWWRVMRWSDIGHLAGVVVTSYIMLAIPALLVGAMARALAVALGLAPVAQMPAAGLLLPILATLMGVCTALSGGYIAAWLHERAPLASALALGLAMAAVESISFAITSTIPGVLRVLIPVGVIFVATTGGILRLRAVRRARAAA